MNLEHEIDDAKRGMDASYRRIANLGQVLQLADTVQEVKAAVAKLRVEVGILDAQASRIENRNLLLAMQADILKRLEEEDV